MSKSPIWLGYLDAGSKSSLVVTDQRLNTGDPLTMYVYNHARGQILEYRREIVEPKLREIDAAQDPSTRGLKSAFETARRAFQPRAARVLNIPEVESPRPRTAEAPEAVEEDGEEVLAEEAVVGEDVDWDEEEAS
jgi:hypothetical protein